MSDRALIERLRNRAGQVLDFVFKKEGAPGLVSIPRSADDVDALLCEAADRVEALTGGEAADKIEGLEIELFEAVHVAYLRGAVEWTRLNYPAWYERFKVGGGQPLSPPSETELVQELHELRGRPGREEIARKLAALRGHRDIDAMIWINDAQREEPVWRLYLEQADAILALFDFQAQPPSPAPGGE